MFFTLSFSLKSRKKENMLASRKSSANEKQLFHGTNPEIVDAICKQNFDWRLHGKNATVYGQGSYFALNSSYSDAYAKEDLNFSKFMFVARVLVGSYAVGQSSYRRPPQKDPSNPASDLYDSCVDDRWSPTIFVVFDTDQCYPEYIIEYSIIQTAHGGHHGNYQQPSRQVRASSSGLGVSVSSATGAGSSGYASHSTSTPTRYQSYTSGASGGLYQNRASALSSTSGSSTYSSSASSTSRSRPSSNPPTRSTSQSGTSGYNSGSSANTGSLSTYSSPSSRSCSANPSSSSPPRSLSSPTRKAEVKKNSSRKPKCLIM